MAQSGVIRQIAHGGDSIMTGDAFDRRESALEDEFFHRVDQELIAQLRAQHQHEAELDALQRATGISDRRVLEELQAVKV